MVKATLQQQINEAMKARNEVRVSTLKMLSAELHNEWINKQRELTSEEEIAVVNKEAKKRRDAIEAYEKVGASDKAEREKQELVILEEFLPEQMSDDELQKIVDQMVSEINPQGMQDMGKVIGAVKAKAGSNADGARIASLVKQKLPK
jgi:uncharacterized protein